MTFFDSAIGPGRLALLVLALLIVMGFEFVNGFHDTANAVATVIYTRTLRPKFAVVLSGICNFFGVYVGGIAVAMSIVKLLPAELLASSGSGTGLAMVLALLLSATLWNVGTWYLGLPASSSHTLIGAIVGVGMVNSMMPGHVFGTGVNWHKVTEIGVSLIVSPIFGLAAAALVLVILKNLLQRPELHAPADPTKSPPGWMRVLLVGTSSGVSFAHGSNDGQKGVGLVMLILIGILPADFALNGSADGGQIARAVFAARDIEKIAAVYEKPDEALVASNAPLSTEESPARSVFADAASVRAALQGKDSVRDVPVAERWSLRTKIQRIEANLALLDKSSPEVLSKEEAADLKRDRQTLKNMVEYAPSWVLLAVALALGVGTMIGWKRIVLTVGEKIGKTHMSYSQGAAAELVAASTIGMSAALGLPVSTTHVLSSGIAGTMLAQRSGLQKTTVRNIALAWLLTLPVSMLLAGVFFVALRQVIPNAKDLIHSRVDSSVAANDPESTPAVAIASSRPLRLQGSNTIGAQLGPRLAEGFFASRNAMEITQRRGATAQSTTVAARMAAGGDLEVIEIVAAGSATGFQGLFSRECDIGLSSRQATAEEANQLAVERLGDVLSPALEHVIGLDGIAIVVNAKNPVRVASREELTLIFSGAQKSWSASGSAIDLYARDEQSGTYDVFRALVLGDLRLSPNAKRFVDNGRLAEMVASNERGIGFVPAASVGNAKTVGIRDGTSRVFYPSEFNVTTEDYPLARRLYLYTTNASTHPLARAFIDFALSAAGQKIVAETGFVNLDIREAAREPCGEGCPAKYAELAGKAHRLSVEFRFRRGTMDLDSRALEDLERLTAFAQVRGGAKIALVGFADDVPASLQRAQTVETKLKERGVAVELVEALGAEMSVASNSIEAGREKNRRVEAWLLDAR
jgi:PiT family inorganic phosphate transporter